MSPPEASTDDQVWCPHCAATFTLGNAVEVSLPQLLRVWQQPQESKAVAYDTAENIPWAIWAELVIDETSIESEPVERDHGHIATSEVHVVESELTGEKSFQTTVAPTSENSGPENGNDLFDFVIEGEEASKIYSKQELELSEKASRSKSSSKFDLTFDEVLLEEGEARADRQDHNRFDFNAEAGKLEPGAFGIQRERSAFRRAPSSLSRPNVENRDTVAVAFSQIGRGKRPSQLRQSAIIGTSGLFLLFALYYTLNFFGGTQFDLLGIYLPGCPHTYGKAPELASVVHETDGMVSDLDQSLDQLQDSSSHGDRKPTLPKSVMAYRLPVRDNRPNENGIKDPVQNPTYRTTTELFPSNGLSDNGLYRHPDLYISRVSFKREREIFELPENEVGLLAHPLFDVRELEATLTTVHEVFGCPRCQSTGYILSPDGKEKVTCDLCMGEPPNVMSVTCYPYFCQLGQVVSLLKDDSLRSNLARGHVKDLLDKTVTSQQEYHELAKLVLARLESPLHNTEGIMITGFVKFTEPRNGLYVANIIVPDSDQRIFVVSDHPFDFLAADQVVLLGSVVVDPGKNIAGYPETTTKPWVIWHGASTVLPQNLFE